jgi:hypothetical protein
MSHMEQHALQPAVPEKTGLGDQLYHVTASQKLQMLSLIAEKVYTLETEVSLKKKTLHALSLYLLPTIFPFFLGGSGGHCAGV